MTCNRYSAKALAAVVWWGASPRGYCRGQAHAQHASFQLQQLGIVDFDHHFVARQKVAQVGGVEVFARALQHHRQVARLDGFFVSGFGFFLFDHGACHALAVEFDRHAQQHAAPGQREGVDAFEVVAGGVAVNLPQLHAQHETLQLTLGLHRLQGDGLSVIAAFEAHHFIAHFCFPMQT